MNLQNIVGQARRLPIIRPGNRSGCPTTPFFATLNVYHDAQSRSAAMNMAIDEALLETADRPIIRFYRWDHPALSFGYFGKFADVERLGPERDLVRRWTGGGIVFHGDDLTYSIVVPGTDPLFGESSMSIYEQIHRALGEALWEMGQAGVTMSARRDALPRVQDSPRRVPPISGYSCFENPVRADVMLNGQKIAGAAQRRTKRGLLQQGSIQFVALRKEFEDCFAQVLSTRVEKQALDGDVMRRAEEISAQKYATEAWLRKR